MTHPCADHPCDHCYLCDVVGICCQTVRAAAPVASDADDKTLRRAILAERDSTVSLAELILAEAPEANPPPAHPARPANASERQPLSLSAPEVLPPLFVRNRMKGRMP
jgi:hypothetical protein